MRTFGINYLSRRFFLSFFFFRSKKEIDQDIPTVFDVVQQVDRWGTYEGLDRHPGEDESVFGELRVTLLAYSQITQRPCFLRSSMGASMGIQISGKQLRNLAISGRALRKSNQSLTNFYHILSSTLLFQRKVAAERERERERFQQCSRCSLCVY